MGHMCVALPCLTLLRTSQYAGFARRWSVYFTGAGINTARSFGPAVVTGFPYGSQWVVCSPLLSLSYVPDAHLLHLQYWVGPFLGALLGSAFYTLLKQYVSVLPPLYLQI